MIKHRSNNMNKKNEKNRQPAAAPREAARSGATIALASDVKVTTTDKVIYGQTPPETDSPPATNSGEDTQSPASGFLSDLNCDVRVTLRSPCSGPSSHVRTANIRKVAGVMMLNVDNRETWLPLQWIRPNSNGVGLKEPTPRTCQTN